MRRLLAGFFSILVFTGVFFAEPPAPLFAQPPGVLFKKGVVIISGPGIEPGGPGIEQGGRSIRLEVEIAGSPEARSRGLMHRKRLPDNAGMLFIYPSSAPRAFWMKNTLIPLSIAYISSGWRITEIIRMNPPGDNNDPPTYPSKNPARYALEVNQGWFERNGVGIGARVRVE